MLLGSWRGRTKARKVALCIILYPIKDKHRFVVLCMIRLRCLESFDIRLYRFVLLRVVGRNRRSFYHTHLSTPGAPHAVLSLQRTPSGTYPGWSPLAFGFLLLFPATAPRPFLFQRFAWANSSLREMSNPLESFRSISNDTPARAFSMRLRVS